MSRPTRVVMLVDNAVAGDSRVVKSARSAQAAGYDMVVLGTAPRPADTAVGGVPVLLRPVRLSDQPASLAQLLAGVVGVHPSTAARRRLALSGARVERARAAASSASGGRAVALRGKAFAALAIDRPGRVVSTARHAALTFSTARRPWRASLLQRAHAPGWALRGWRAWDHLDPLPERLSNGWQAELGRLRPDLIHAHDYRTLPAAIRYARDAHAAGWQVRVVYDAHEWVQGYDELGPQRHRAAVRIESSLIGQADAVVTVASEIAERLRSTYRLGSLPTVVLNAPEPSVGPVPGPTLRERCRVGTDTPLLVYSGSVGKGRNLRMCVDALTQLPGVHLALVIAQPDSGVAHDLVARADELGVRDRLHLTRYVDQEHVVGFLSEATAGVTPLVRSRQFESSLPTKVLELLLAGRPQVVSDQRTMADFVTGNGLGEAFAADDVGSYAEAVRRVLAAPPPTVREDLAFEHSWPVQAGRLLQLYGELVPSTDETSERRNIPAVLGDTRPSELVLPHTDGRTPVRLLIGASNSAGQGWAWARAVAEHLPGVQADNVAIDTGAPYGFPATRVVATAERRDPVWVQAFERETAAMRTHVLLESGTTVVGSALDARTVGAEVARFERSGLSVGVVLHGSEVRDPARHAARYPWSPFHTADPDFVATLQKRCDTTGPVVEWLGLPTFVSTLDLLDDVPHATWLPVVVDVDRWASPAPVLERDRPVVVHAPTRAALKGSAHLDPVLRTLEAEGLLTYCRLESVPHEQVMAAIRAADIVVDQLGVGAYGTVSIESMAAGRVTMAQVSPAVRQRLAHDLPIVDISAATFEHDLRAVLAEREEHRARAAQAPEFARTFHDGRAAAVALAPFLGVRGG